MKSAATYAILLNFKHIYLYSAPAFGLFYVRQLLFSGSASARVINFIKLASVTVFSTLLSFGPILLSEQPIGKEGVLRQLKQIGSRLFPFDRGLVHDYMAANIWALYTVS